MRGPCAVCLLKHFMSEPEGRWNRLVLVVVWMKPANIKGLKLISQLLVGFESPSPTLMKMFTFRKNIFVITICLQIHHCLMAGWPSK